ncbi:MAG: radical SAM protein [Acidimicrobiia bacterium]
MKTRLTDFGLRWLNLALTARCNMRCLFCPINDFQYTTTEMDVGLAERIFTELQEDGTIRFVALAGFGEPFCHPGLPDILTCAKVHAIPVKLATNGTLLNAAAHDWLGHDPEFLKISVQNLNQEEFTRLRGCRMSFNKYLRGIADFLLQGIKGGSSTQVVIDLAYTGDDYLLERNLAPPRDHLFERRARAFVRTFVGDYLGMPFERSRWKFDSPDWDAIHGEVVYEATPNIRFCLKNFWQITDIARNRPTPDRFTCRNDYLWINMCGDVRLCCNDYVGATSIGNVAETPLLDLVRSSEDVVTDRDFTRCRNEYCRRCRGDSGDADPS